MEKQVMVEGMKCANCAAHVEKALNDICGITSATVNLVGKVVHIELAHPVEDEKIKLAISEAGYSVINIK